MNKFGSDYDYCNLLTKKLKTNKKKDLYYL